MPKSTSGSGLKSACKLKWIRGRGTDSGPFHVHIHPTFDIMTQDRTEDSDRPSSNPPPTPTPTTKGKNIIMWLGGVEGSKTAIYNFIVKIRQFAFALQFAMKVENWRCCPQICYFCGVGEGGVVCAYCFKSAESESVVGPWVESECVPLWAGFWFRRPFPISRDAVIHSETLPHLHRPPHSLHT
jgi:hypothetical protein